MSHKEEPQLSVIGLCFIAFIGLLPIILGILIITGTGDWSGFNSKHGVPTDTTEESIDVYIKNGKPSLIP
jgi:hypothetical protein